MARLPCRRTILLVEDDADVREAITDILREAGREVVEAADGLSALAMLDQVQRPCLILLDLLMPAMDGLEFLQKLKSHPDAADFGVLVLSGLDNMTAAEHYPGVVGTLRKPFDVDQLLSCVAEPA